MANLQVVGINGITITEDIGNQTVIFDASGVHGSQGPAGQNGTSGGVGVQGTNGPQGPNAVMNVAATQVLTSDEVFTSNGNNVITNTVLTVTLQPGNYSIQGFYQLYPISLNGGSGGYLAGQWNFTGSATYFTHELDDNGGNNNPAFGGAINGSPTVSFPQPSSLTGLWTVYANYMPWWVSGYITVTSTGVLSLRYGFTGATGGSYGQATLKAGSWLSATPISSSTGTTTGFQGLQGIQGPIGPQGALGFQGDIGPTGAFGGPIGPQGNDGPIGVQGSIGSIGSIGPTGSVGATGPQGQVGVTGPSGGPTGPQGVQGQNGTIGSNGLQGPIGIGVQGLQGIQGPIGPQGAIGLQGTIGSNGLQGAIGPTGSGLSYSQVITPSQQSTTSTLITDAYMQNIYLPIGSYSITLYLLMNCSTSGNNNNVNINYTFTGVASSFVINMEGWFTGGFGWGNVNPTVNNHGYNSLVNGIGTLTVTTPGYFAVQWGNNHNGDTIYVDAGSVLTINGPGFGEGVIGPQGNTGINGTQGVTGPVGTQGNTGISGTQGSIGPQGYQSGSDVPIRVTRTTDNTQRFGGTAISDDGILAVALAANHTYKVKIFVRVQLTAGTSTYSNYDLAVQIGYNGSGTNTLTMIAYNARNSAMAAHYWDSATIFPAGFTDSVNSLYTSPTSANAVILDGIFTTSGAGNLSFQWGCAEPTITVAINVLAGSYIEAVQIA